MSHAYRDSWSSSSTEYFSENEEDWVPPTYKDTFMVEAPDPYLLGRPLLVLEPTSSSPGARLKRTAHIARSPSPEKRARNPLSLVLSQPRDDELTFSPVSSQLATQPCPSPVLQMPIPRHLFDTIEDSSLFGSSPTENDVGKLKSYGITDQQEAERAVKLMIERLTPTGNKDTQNGGADTMDMKML